MGCLAIGIFADGAYGNGWNGVADTVKRLLYGNVSQFFAQSVGFLTNIVYVGLIPFTIYAPQIYS